MKFLDVIHFAQREGLNVQEDHGHTNGAVQDNIPQATSGSHDNDFYKEPISAFHDDNYLAAGVCFATVIEYTGYWYN